MKCPICRHGETENGYTRILNKKIFWLFWILHPAWFRSSVSKCWRHEISGRSFMLRQAQHEGLPNTPAAVTMKVVNIFCGSDAYVATSANIFSRDVGVAPTSGFDFPGDESIFMTVRMIHALALQNMPLHHKDPFDRLLIAQAMVNQIPLPSADQQLSAYGIEGMVIINRYFNASSWK